MKRSLLAIAFLFSSAATALAAQVEWLGYICITSNPLSAACVTDGIGLGECASLRFSPPNIGTNGTSTRLSLFEQHWAENYTLPAGSLVGTTFQTVNGTGTAKGVWTFNSQMRMTQTPAPANLTAATKTVTLTGEIQDYDGAAGCDVTFRAAVTLRPPH